VTFTGFAIANPWIARLPKQKEFWKPVAYLHHGFFVLGCEKITKKKIERAQ